MMPLDWVARAQGLELQVRNFVGGRLIAPTGGEIIHKWSPRDGSLLCEFSSGGMQDVDDAVAQARSSFADGRWSRLDVERRKAALYRLAELIGQHRDELALLESLDVGKPIRDAWSFDLPASMAKIRYCAEALDKLHAKVYAANASNLSYELRRPVGVVAGIVGWNFPLLLAVSKIAPVLATGNSLVLKPSEFTSLSAARVAELAGEAGVPDGVLNVVNGGPQVGAALARHCGVDLLTFTGSSLTGSRLMVAAGESNMKRLILECGGKAPNIVFDDCPDLAAVADSVVRRAFWNQGEVCSASSRLLVHRPIKDALLRLIVEKTVALVMGDPLQAETQFGALVSAPHREKVLRYIGAGERDGAHVAYQSPAAAPHAGGFYVPPVIFDGVSPGQTIAQEEIFGPVLCVISFEDEAEAVSIANGTIYGLTATLWTRDLGRAHRVTQAIGAGLITVNSTTSPCGGAETALSVGGHKQSGIGTEGGLDGLAAYTSSTAVQIFV
jgi:acyl-CoA reductase-like NAD-dependent aldehyde dehydrogenase